MNDHLPIHPASAKPTSPILAEAKERNAEQAQIANKIAELVQAYHAAASPDSFDPAAPRVQYAGRVFDGEELRHLVDCALEFRLTSGRYAQAFAQALSQRMGLRSCYLVNSGSSANLLAFAALTSPRLGDRRIARGDEVITLAAGFPTTVTPILQYGARPVFVDIEVPSFNIDFDQLEAALSERSRAVMLAHTLGNPFDAARLRAFCDQHKLWLIEDCCDALGATLNGRSVGQFGHLATLSFYPAHHITTGEGGAVLTNEAKLAKLVESLPDWGRDCWCPPGVDNSCGKRFTRQHGQLPAGYDHKFTYGQLGYNLKMTDLQAAVGYAQIQKLDDFVKARRKNWQAIAEALTEFSDDIDIARSVPGAEPSWFGFPICLRPGLAGRREAIVRDLEAQGIQTRMLFGGNLTRQPALVEWAKTAESEGEDPPYRSVGPLPESDRVMRDMFWVGVYPGLDEARLAHTIGALRRALNEHLGPTSQAAG